MAILVDANQIAISHLMVRNKIEDGINIASVRRSIIRVIGRIEINTALTTARLFFAMTTRTTGAERSFLSIRRTERTNVRLPSMTGIRCFLS